MRCHRYVLQHWDKSLGPSKRRLNLLIDSLPREKKTVKIRMLLQKFAFGESSLTKSCLRCLGKKQNIFSPNRPSTHPRLSDVFLDVHTPILVNLGCKSCVKNKKYIASSKKDGARFSH